MSGEESQGSLEEEAVEAGDSQEPEMEEGGEPSPEAEPDLVEEFDPAEVAALRELARPAGPQGGVPASPEAVVETLRQLREDVGQISELSSEEGSIVGAFSLAFLKLMEPLTKALPVDAAVLPPELGAVEKANVLPKGDLVVLYNDGRMESVDLTDAGNRDLLVTVVSDAMPRFNALISQRRTKIEGRINFLSNVTRELQSIADSMEVG